MRSSTQEIADILLGGYRKHGRLVLLFDYDGTLAPIAEHPRLARLPRRTRRLLERLAERPGVFVGVLSGRAIEDLKEMVCLPGLCLAGTAGLELDLGGLRISHRQVNRTKPLLTRLVRRLREMLSIYPGAWLEDKQIGFTIHYRHVDASQADSLRVQCEEALEPYSDQFRILGGPMAIEVSPELGWNKGTAVRAILDHFRINRTALLYAGDSENDAEALETVASLGGVALGIGPEAPATASYHLESPGELEALLTSLDDSLRRRQSASASTRALAVYGLWKSSFPTGTM